MVSHELYWSVRVFVSIGNDKYNAAELPILTEGSESLPLLPLCAETGKTAFWTLSTFLLVPDFPFSGISFIHLY